MVLFSFFNKRAPGAKENKAAPTQETSSQEKGSVEMTAVPNIVTDFPERHDPNEDVIPVEEIIHTLNMNDAGLYPHEILALEYANKYCLGEDKFQGFWWYQYGIKDMNKLLESLRDRGFLTIGTASESLQLYKIDDLKRILTEKGLKTSGKKNELITRLVEVVPENELCLFFPRKPYVLTDLGKQSIKYDEYILYAHRHHYEGIDIYSLNRLINGHTKTYRDFIWRHFNQLCMEQVGQNNFSGYRNIRFQMGEFVLEEKKAQNALGLFSEVVFWDTSGLGNGKLYLESSGPYWFPYADSLAKTYPGVVNKIIECKSILNDDTKFNQTIEHTVKLLSSPFHIFSKEEVVSIIHYEITKNTEQLNRLYEEAKARLQKQHPSISFDRIKY